MGATSWLCVVPSCWALGKQYACLTVAPTHGNWTLVAVAEKESCKSDKGTLGGKILLFKISCILSYEVRMQCVCLWVFHTLNVFIYNVSILRQTLQGVMFSVSYFISCNKKENCETYCKALEA